MWRFREIDVDIHAFRLETEPKTLKRLLSKHGRLKGSFIDLVGNRA